MADGRQAAEEEDHNVEQGAEEEARNQTSARDSGRIREGWSGSCEAAAAGPLLGGSGRGARRPPEAATGAGEGGGRRTQPARLTATAAAAISRRAGKGSALKQIRPRKA